MQVMFPTEVLIQENLIGYNYKDTAFTELRAINRSDCLGAFSLCHKNPELLVFNKKTNQEDFVFFNTTLKKCNGSM